MDEMQNINRVVLCGAPVAEPVFSHSSRTERFYAFPLEVSRLSGAMERLNVILREELLHRNRLFRFGSCGERTHED